MAHARCAPAPSSRSRRRSPGNRCSGSNCRRDARGSVAGSATTPVSADPAPPSTFPACKSRIATHCDRETQPAGRRSRRCRTILRWFRPTRHRACTASVRQDRTISPFTRTVQAPQTPCSQPTCVPVSCRCSRRKSARLSRGRTCASTASPLTWSEIAMGASPGPPAARSGRPSSAATQRTSSSFARCRRIDSRRLLVALGIEFCGQRRRCVRQQCRRDRTMSISLEAALASTGRSPTAKNTGRKSAKDFAAHDGLCRQARRWRSRHAAARIHRRNAPSSPATTGSSTATSNSCAVSAVS